MQRIIIAAAIAALIAAPASAQTPAPAAAQLSPGAAVLKQACAAEFDTVVAYDVAKTGHTHEVVVKDAESVLETASTLTKDRAEATLTRMTTAEDKGPPPYYAFSVCVLKQRLAQL
jgi:4-aminobutyrate aminotransferase-like enzyme